MIAWPDIGVRSYFEDDSVQIYHGDCRDVLAQMPDESVHCVVTSPPYLGLRDYGLEASVWGGDHGCGHEWGGSIKGKSHSGSLNGSTLDGAPSGPERRPEWASSLCRVCNAWRGSLGLEPTPDLYVQHLVEIFREVRRVLSKDGSVWLNLGDSYASSAGGYGAGGSPGSTSWALAPGTKAAVLRDKLRKAPAGLKPKDIVGIPWRVAFALQADGWWLRSDIIWSKPNPMPESVTDRPTKSHEYLFLLTKAERYYYDADAIREPPKTTDIAIAEDLRGESWHDHKNDLQMGQRQLHSTSKKAVPFNGRNKRTVWEIPTQPFPSAHFATFPEKLVQPCIKAGTSEWGCCAKCGVPYERIVERGDLREHPDRLGRTDRNVADFDGIDYSKRDSTLGLVRELKNIGWRKTCQHRADVDKCIVLDPFGGAGTVGVVARKMGRRAILIEANEEYCEMMKNRMAQGVLL